MMLSWFSNNETGSTIIHINLHVHIYSSFAMHLPFWSHEEKLLCFWAAWIVIIFASPLYGCIRLETTFLASKFRFAAIFWDYSLMNLQRFVFSDSFPRQKSFLLSAKMLAVVDMVMMASYWFNFKVIRYTLSRIDVNQNEGIMDHGCVLDVFCIHTITGY